MSHRTAVVGLLAALCGTGLLSSCSGAQDVRATAPEAKTVSDRTGQPLGDPAAIKVCRSTLQSQPEDAVLRAAYTTTALAAQHARAALFSAAGERAGQTPAGGVLESQQDNWNNIPYRDDPLHQVSYCVVDSELYTPSIPPGFPVPDRSIYFVGDAAGPIVFLIAGLSEATDGQPPLSLDRPQGV